MAYDDSAASAKVAAVVAASFDAADGQDAVVDVHGVAAYEPGAFYRRELPCLQAALAQLSVGGDAVLVIDGYVFLDADGRKGLGAHLHDATGRAVVGVAKSPFKGSDFARAVVRGSAKRPLFVTAAGVDLGDAAAAVAAMHGKHRLPTLVLRADQLARGHRAV